MKRTFIIVCLTLLICALAMIAVCNIVVIKSSDERCYDDINAIPHATYGLLLCTGSNSVQDPLYQARVKAAIDLYEAGKVDYILISGENLYDDYAELDSMVVAMMEHDIPIAGIDELGKNTLVSLQNIGLQTGYCDSITVISQRFQNVRAIYYAGKMFDPCPIAFNVDNPEKWYSQLFRMCGEWLIRTKVVLMNGRIKRLPDETETLAFWLPYKDSANHAFVMTAEPLWKLCDADMEQMSNFGYLTEWHEQCEGVLLHTFDSIRPDSDLDVHHKTDSMLNILYTFFSDIDEYSNWGDMMLTSLYSSFNTYRVVDKSKVLIKKNPERRKEVERWYEFEPVYNDFCVKGTSLVWWGGSGSALAELAMLSYIQEMRVKDLDNLLKPLKEEDSFDVDAEVVCMRNTTDTVLAVFDIDNEIFEEEDEEDDDTDIYSDYQEEYNGVHEQIVNLRETLLHKYGQWLNIRKKQGIPTQQTANMLRNNVHDIIVFEDGTLLE